MDVGEGLRPRPLVSIFLGLQRPPVKATVYQNVSGAPRIRDWGRERDRGDIKAQAVRQTVGIAETIPKSRNCKSWEI